MSLVLKGCIEMGNDSARIFDLSCSNAVSWCVVILDSVLFGDLRCSFLNILFNSPRQTCKVNLDFTLFFLLLRATLSIAVQIIAGEIEASNHSTNI